MILSTWILCRPHSKWRFLMSRLALMSSSKRPMLRIGCWTGPIRNVTGIPSSLPSVVLTHRVTVRYLLPCCMTLPWASLSLGPELWATGLIHSAKLAGQMCSSAPVSSTHLILVGWRDSHGGSCHLSLSWSWPLTFSNCCNMIWLACWICSSWTWWGLSCLTTWWSRFLSSIACLLNWSLVALETVLGSMVVLATDLTLLRWRASTLVSFSFSFALRFSIAFSFPLLGLTLALLAFGPAFTVVVLATYLACGLTIFSTFLSFTLNLDCIHIHGDSTTIDCFWLKGLETSVSNFVLSHRFLHLVVSDTVFHQQCCVNLQLCWKEFPQGCNLEILTQLLSWWDFIVLKQPFNSQDGITQRCSLWRLWDCQDGFQKTNRGCPGRWLDLLMDQPYGFKTIWTGHQAWCSQNAKQSTLYQTRQETVESLRSTLRLWRQFTHPHWVCASDGCINAHHKLLVFHC